MSTCKLYLVVGDRVRNINPRSNRKGRRATVTNCQVNGYYRVEYDNGDIQVYQKKLAHIYLEKITNEDRQEDKALTFGTRYGAPLEATLGRYHDEIFITVEGMCGTIWDSLQQVGCKEEAPTKAKRTVLSKERKNLISGKTQSEMVKELGHARGVEQFNTRCLGKTTGQALQLIGEAMCNPGKPLLYVNLDHARSQPGCSTSWSTLNKHFRAVLGKHLGDMRGFTLTETHITYNPIVTVETYVENK